MEPDLTHQEMILRRRLLFRLLTAFDFDRPEFRYEELTDPLPAALASPKLPRSAAETGADRSRPPPPLAARGAPLPVSFS